ncbi:uncharacterized protein BDW47DRAFT_128565 [Aspergillus candidus]|uniref:2-oxoadipate dioxygenase/decarboxylase n=1 Tax=Aspergillus candidus TaxID=41067 RepID=A0A2I2F310_ASPCN|nr:hypothetical protein BDW47DRAFT_128565 [Aspergillus candidus]PLB34999.1 hypothetical protein BDW47DRAFT_128565 [Aspergillus candidus]
MQPLGWNPDDLRTRFTEALSDMYRAEVPLYADLVQIVRDVDSSVLDAQGKHPEELPFRNQLERHGAIRLGTKDEMRMIKRLFAILGMHPVGYYDLNIVGFPIYGTAFRPTDADALSKNPFRVFTTVLRRDMISPNIRETVDGILSQRNLFTPRLSEIIDHAEKHNTLSAQEVDDFITEALKIFKWHSQSTVSIDSYLKLKAEHTVVADIVCFPSAHINHLTPRTLDIDYVQQEMIRRGLPTKEVIEGPPTRQCPILLRQTSFKALEERVVFATGDGQAACGTHTARFGEVEQRGAAVTRKGRELYDQLHSFAVRTAANVSGHKFSNILHNAFRKFPDTWEELRVRGLVYFYYSVTQAGRKVMGEGMLTSRVSLTRLLQLGHIECEPITYEDFLPFSAAGIFKSNVVLDHSAALPIQKTASSAAELEGILGCTVLDEIDFYQHLEDDSIELCRKELALEEIIRD